MSEMTPDTGNANPRITGVAQIALGAIALALIGLFVPLRTLGRILGYLGWEGAIVAAIPAVLMLMGLVELVSGVPFWRIADRWDALRGWQRGVLGVVIVAAFFALFFTVGLLYATRS